MTVTFCFVLTHTWCFDGGIEGRYERTFHNYAEAVEDFEYLELLMENDDYDFNAVIPDKKVEGGLIYNGDLAYSIYEKDDSPINRQDLKLERRRVEYGL